MRTLIIKDHILNNKLIRAKTWQEMLIKVCESLIEVDEEKITKFEELEHMNGKKNKCFSVKSMVRNLMGI